MESVDKVLAEAAEKIKQEAYAAGWRDAIAMVTKAIADSAPANGAGAPSNSDSAAASATPRVHSTDSREGPKIGTTPYYVLQAVRKKPGMTGAEVIVAVHADGHQVPEAGIRTALSRLDGRRLIVNRHKKWFVP